MRTIFPRTTDDPFVAYKAVQLLYDFHALRFPEQYATHTEVITIDLADGDETVEVDAPSRFLLNPEIPSTQKAPYLGYMLLCVMSAIESEGVQDPETVVYDYCDLEFAESEGEDLLDNRGETIIARQILPDEETLQAVRTRWLGRQFELERFIETATNPEQ